MLLPGTIAAEPPAGRAIWRSELIETMKLAWPIALTQLGQIAMMTTDLALIGRLGDGAVAAVALTPLILFCGFVLGRGAVLAVCGRRRAGVPGPAPPPARPPPPRGAFGAAAVRGPINLGVRLR